MSSVCNGTMSDFSPTMGWRDAIWLSSDVVSPLKKINFLQSSFLAVRIRMLNKVRKEPRFLHDLCQEGHQTSLSVFQNVSSKDCIRCSIPYCCFVCFWSSLKSLCFSCPSLSISSLSSCFSAFAEVLKSCPGCAVNGYVPACVNICFSIDAFVLIWNRHLQTPTDQGQPFWNPGRHNMKIFIFFKSHMEKSEQFIPQKIVKAKEERILISHIGTNNYYKHIRHSRKRTTMFIID